jgi:hypothetical protein
MKRGAFIDQYKQQPMFRDSLDEFESSKEVTSFTFQYLNLDPSYDYFIENSRWFNN